MYIERIPNRNSPPAVLLRESFRQDGKVRKRTLANLSRLPPDVVEALSQLLKGAAVSSAPLQDRFDIVRSQAHGHVAAVLGSLRACGLERLLDRRRSRERDLICALIVARLLAPGSKLATARQLHPDTASSSLGEELQLGAVDENELYAAMDWLLQRQDTIEAGLARRHLSEGALVLYDLTSTYVEGRCCELAAYGYSRDHRRDRMQVVFGLLCDRSGRPLAVQAFEGNTADPATVGAQVAKLRDRFGLSRVVLVGDRGMLTEARLREDLVPQELDWISALRAPAIRKLVESGTLQLDLFDERDLMELRCESLYPGERLVVCRNPRLAVERTRRRQELLAATEKNLRRVQAATQRKKKPLRGAVEISEQVFRELGRHKMRKHYVLDIGEDRFSWRRDPARIAAEAALDGFYVIRTSVEEARLDAEQTVLAYKDLSRVERAFRSLKTVDLKVRPLHHRRAHRVRAHLLVCLLAYYVEWHMRARLAPMLFDDEAGPERDEGPVAPARRSDRAQAKVTTGRTEDGLPVHSFQTLLADLATLAKQTVRPKPTHGGSFSMLTQATAVQEKAFRLLGVRLTPPRP